MLQLLAVDVRSTVEGSLVGLQPAGLDPAAKGGRVLANLPGDLVEPF